MPPILTFLLALVACGSPPKPPSAAVEATVPGTSAVGAACDGTCADGLLCMPAPGGYCTAPCGATGSACPTGSACVPTGRGGEICARSCTSDAECRADQGYRCDPGRDVCLLPFMTSPKLAECPGAPPPDGDFAPAVELSSPALPGVYQFEPSATLTPDGQLVALFSSNGPMFGPSQLVVARVPVGGAPITEVLATSRTRHFDAWTATSRDGAVHAAWLGHDGGGVDRNAEIGYARSLDAGATWSTPAPVHAAADCPPETPHCLDKPMIAAGPVPGSDADAVRVFYFSAGALRMRSSLDGGGTWDEPASVVEGAYGDVTIDGKGAIHLAVALAAPVGERAWGSPDNSIVYTVSRDGRTFGAPVAVSAPGESVPFFFVNPTLAVDEARGVVHVAYASGASDGRWDIQLATSADDGRTWARTRVNDDAPCANHMVPNLALDPRDGTVHVTFLENRGGKGHLAYTTCAAGGGSCAPVVRASEDMAAYELVRHSSMWLGEYQSLLVDPRRRVLHSVWTHTVREADAAVARIRHSTRALPP